MGLSAFNRARELKAQRNDPMAQTEGGEVAPPSVDVHPAESKKPKQPKKQDGSKK